MVRIKHSGYSLVELMAVLAVLAVIAAMASASWAPIVRRTEVDASVNRFVTSMSYARSEAIRRGGWVVLERLLPPLPPDAASPAPTDWSYGWRTYQDINNNGTYDDGSDELIETEDLVAGLSITASGITQRIRLTPNGTSLGLSIGSLKFAHDGGTPCIKLTFNAGLRLRRDACT